MSTITVSKKHILSGEITVSGSKNAALPIIFSTLTVAGTSRLANVPDIRDVGVAVEILKDLGASVVREGSALYINTDDVKYKIPRKEDVSSLRASTYLLGAMLVRFGRAPVMNYGGCGFDLRPIDMHVRAAISLGASLDRNTLVANELLGADIYFDKISVGATVNAIIMAASAEGVTRIYGTAQEPHVDALVDFLVSAGANITYKDNFLEIKGSRLRDGCVEIIPDMIEAGTFLSLSILTGGNIRVKGALKPHLSSFTECLSNLGAKIEFRDNSIIASGNISAYHEILTSPYPGFPTDLQPIVAPLLAIGKGGRIIEGVWHNRFGYLAELSKFGLNYERYNGYAEIYKSNLVCSEASAPDLRGGAALLLTALSAEGESIIHRFEMLKRGYENLKEKLMRLGADIKERNT